MKKITYSILICLIFILPSVGGVGGGLYAQDTDLFRTWYLTKVTVNSIDYIPSNYGYYPDLNLSDDNGNYGISLADPKNISCGTSIENFQSNPNSFMVNQNDWLCLPEHTCHDAPDAPCSTIYGNHAKIYHGITTPITYIIVQNSDGTFSLEISNTEGNKAYYSSELLSNQNFILNEFKLYPNPVKETLYIKSNFSEAVTGHVYDIKGKFLQSQVLEPTQKQIDVRNINPGLYFLILVNESGAQVSKKFVKK